MTLRDPSSAIRVRLAIASDIDVLVELMEEFYAEAAFPLSREWATAAFSDLIADPTRGAVWLVDVEGQVAGHIVLSVRFTMEFGGLIAYIDDLFVRPAYRRRGAARAGLDVLVAESRRRGCRSLLVEVGPDNAAALALYGSIGLTPRADERQELRVVLTD